LHFNKICSLFGLKLIVKYTNYYILILFIQLTLSCLGQYQFNNFSEDQGLSSNQVRAILQDDEGFIWLATSNGLVRYDGEDFITYQNIPGDSTSLTDNFLLAIHQEKEGNIWIGTINGGVNVLNPKERKFTNYSNNPLDSSSITADMTKLIFEDNLGNLWLSVSDKGIDLFNRNDSSFINFRPTDQIEGLSPRLANSIICYTPDNKNDNKLWFGSLEGIFSFDINSKTWTHFPVVKSNTNNPELYGGQEDVVQDIKFDQQGNLWFGTWGGGIGKMNIHDGKFELFKYESTFPVIGLRNNVKKLVWKSEHEFWIAAPHKGLGIFDINDNSFRYIYDINRNKSGIAIHNPLDIITNKNGQIWVATSNRGLFYTHTDAFPFNKQIKPEGIISFGKSDDNLIWAGSLARYGQLLKIDKATNIEHRYNYTPVEDKAEHHFVNIMNGKNGRLWLAEHFRLYYKDKSSGIIQPYLKFNPIDFTENKSAEILFTSATIDNYGRIWMGSKFQGLYCIDPGSEIIKNYFYIDADENTPMFAAFVFDLFTDSRGRVWYGSRDFGYFDLHKDAFVNFSYPRDFGNSDVKLHRIYSITETRDGNIWLGTSNSGIAVININSDSVYFVRSYKILSGLVNNRIENLLTDKSGNVWASTPDGLSKIDPISHEIENYGSDYGMSNILCMQLEEDGEIFVGTRNGYYRFYPEDITSIKPLNKPYIKSFKVFDDPQNINTCSDSTQKIKLKPDQNFFSIEYGAISYFNRQQTTFKYKLDGLDENWQNAGNRKYVSYTNLSGGNYTFRLKANGENEISLPIFIATPFWKTWWFILLITLVIVGFAVLVHLYRTRQIKKREELKSSYNKKISELEVKALRTQMNPHFLFNSLNSIRYYILKEDNKNASEYITKFSRLLRLILKNSRQNQISLKDELHALEIYIDFEQMRFNKKFEYTLEVDSSINQEKIQVQPLTIQPFVENAIWHGLMPKEGNGVLIIKIDKDNGTLKIIVEDNGIGRQKASEIKKEELTDTKSYGLQITEERMKLMSNIRGKQSEFKITDLYDKKKPAGTKVIITFEI